MTSCALDAIRLASFELRVVGGVREVLVGFFGAQSSQNQSPSGISFKGSARQ